MANTEYFTNLEKWCKGEGVEPVMTIAVDSAGEVFLCGNASLSNQDRAKVLLAAAQSLKDCIMKEKLGMANAQIIDPSKIRKMT